MLGTVITQLASLPSSVLSGIGLLLACCSELGEFLDPLRRLGDRGPRSLILPRLRSVIGSTASAATSADRRTWHLAPFRPALRHRYNGRPGDFHLSSLPRLPRFAMAGITSGRSVR
jgi:hypothetical protein